MGVEVEIYSRLSNYSGLTALVGNRIYPGKLPQSTTKPAITYSRVSSQRFSAFSADSGVVKARYQFSVFATKYDDALAVREQLRAALQRWSASNTPKVFDTYLLNELDLYESDTGLHHLLQDYEINYQEA